MKTSADAQGMRDLRHLKVLLIDDNRHMLHLMHRILASMRIKYIQEKSNAADAFKELKFLAPDVIFVDWVMEPVDGCEFVKMVRGATDSAFQNVPIVMVTAHTEEYRIKAAIAAGVNGFLAKPISPQMVYQRICAVLDDPRPMNQRQQKPAEAAEPPAQAARG
jgi:DNA-binding NarL/FixJ family response regulator